MLISWSLPAAAAIEVFDASGTFADGGLLSGTVTIDTGRGKVTAADVFLTNTSSPFEASLIKFAGKQVGMFSDDYFLQVAKDATLNQYMNLLFKSDLVGYRGGVIYGDLRPAPGGFVSSYAQTGSPQVDLSIGALARPGAAVPEPATWGLLVCGLGAAGGMRRRRVAVSRASTVARQAS